ncbi:hypothetical protein HIF96_06365 [Helcococcus kunzii]|uniref:hypothetical protein n=1 Tax=Helcococcus kunzii TaxID=40091 RepID=UPI001C93851C|nr:hypothetical protein [Helcococcus kunzii]QZO75906.1 hypothetical protein HIF96_06365 [Helcococcus kunzii]
MDVNQQKMEQDLIRESEIELDNKVNNETDNKTEKDLFKEEGEDKKMNEKDCRCKDKHKEDYHCDEHECDCDKDECNCDEHKCDCDEHDGDSDKERIDKDLMDDEESEFKEGGKSKENEFDIEGAVEEEVVEEKTEDDK